MTLRGWVNPLPQFIVEAVAAGHLVVVKVPLKGGDYFEALRGTITNPQDTILEFR